jgi:acetylornithine aminotransferase
VLPLPEGFLEAARRLTREHDALMIVDEVQTGMGRTGTWFAFQRAGVMPDVFTLAKGLGGGVPIGATVTTGRASGILHAGDHGSTFGGNPLATSAGRAVIGAIESEHLLDNVARRSAELRELLAGLPLVADVRGQGLLLGVRLERSVAPRLVTAALAVGLIINAPDEQTIRLAPPLVIGEPEVAEFGERWTAACRSLDRQSDDTERQDA